jgi:ankyrin repeat protein
VNAESGQQSEHAAAQELVSEGNAAGVGAALRAGADPNPSLSTSMGPLHWAAFAGQAACVELLLEHGASLRLRNPDGWTALHAACYGGRFDTARALLSFGAPPPPPPTVP